MKCLVFVIHISVAFSLPLGYDESNNSGNTSVKKDQAIVSSNVIEDDKIAKVIMEQNLLDKFIAEILKGDLHYLTEAERKNSNEKQEKSAEESDEKPEENLSKSTNEERSSSEEDVQEPKLKIEEKPFVEKDITEPEGVPNSKPKSEEIFIESTKPLQPPKSEEDVQEPKLKIEEKPFVEKEITEPEGVPNSKPKSKEIFIESTKPLQPPKSEETPQEISSSHEEHVLNSGSNERSSHEEEVFDLNLHPVQTSEETRESTDTLENFDDLQGVKKLAMKHLSAIFDICNMSNVHCNFYDNIEGKPDDNKSLVPAAEIGNIINIMIENFAEHVHKLLEKYEDVIPVEQIDNIQATVIDNVMKFNEDVNKIRKEINGKTID